MEMVTTVANLRSTTEEDVINKYTFRQATHISGTYLRDKMLVLTVVSKALGQISDPSKEGNPSQPTAMKKGRLPSWFKPKTGKYEIVDLDGNLNMVRTKVAEYMNGGAVRR